MSLSETRNLAVEVSGQADHLEALVEKAFGEGSAGEIEEKAVQQLLALGVRLYAAKMELECDFPPFSNYGGITATDVMIIVTEMLKSQNFELFELGMWQAAWKKSMKG